MSRLPPRPAGLPPRPNRRSREETRAERSNRSHRDQYRGQGDDQNRSQRDNYRPRSPPAMYHFRGNDRYSDQRSAYDDRDLPERYEDRAPGNSMSRRRDNLPTDTFRPQEDGFSFRHEPPPSLSSRITLGPRARSPRRSPPRQRPRELNSNYRSNGSGMQRNRGGYRGRGGPRLASEREFLKGNRAPTPELMPGMDDEEGSGVRYKPIEDVSDSDEAEMDMSDEEDSAADQPKQKQARTEQKPADAESVPRWSNPDPYTALPPPDESQRKKKDVVKLIRKARVNTSSESTSKAEADPDDFISLDFGNEPEEPEYEPPPAISNGVGVPGAPSGPKSSSLRSHDAPKTEPRKTLSISLPRADPNSIQNKLPAKPPAPIDLTDDSSEASRKRKPKNEKSNPLNKHVKTEVDAPLGNRKRNFRDELKPPPIIHESLKGKKPESTGRIVRQWRLLPNTDDNPTPWTTIDHTNTVNMGLWLHKEIMDFYHYVRPREFEEVIRTKLVEDLNIRLRREFQDVEVRAFGSFPAGLYLPTADMDLVMVSNQFLNGGRGIHGQSGNSLHRFGRWLEREKLSLPASLEVISKAKVPLVKYVDRITGLKVDISFENDTGLIANGTFQEWKAHFPAMPILVTLIKHLLAMRGLNEPVNGGIGGFSVTCLVVSLLQHMPQVQSKSMVAEHHLGEILMEFLDLYGNEFNTATTAIQLKPPGYISKAHANVAYKGSSDKFMILDPNNPQNDISGGSKNTMTIRKCFSNAYKELSQKMASLQNSPNRQGQSLLGCILAGNYSSFTLQREHLQHVHEITLGPISDTA